MARTLAGYDAPFGPAASGVVFGPLAAVAGVVGSIAQVGGTLAGMGSAMAAGKAGKIGAALQGQAAMQSAEYRAKQLEQQAQEARASQQRVALETRRKGDIIQSTLRARAAAGGGGATDNTVLNLTGQIAGRTEYDALLEMYKGENAARGMQDAAKAARYQGQVGLTAAGLQGQAIDYQTRGTIAQSFGSLGSSIGGLGSSLSGLNFGGAGTTLPGAGPLDLTRMMPR